MTDALSPDVAMFQHVAKVSRVFTPTAPITARALFAGRIDQMHRVGRALFQPGQHVAIYGERGVGKTSLVNIIAEVFSSQDLKVIAQRVGCDQNDTYAGIWRRFFDLIPLEQEEPTAGFHPGARLKRRTLADELPEELTTFDVHKALKALTSSEYIVAPIIDEFDRIADPAVRASFADTIKMLSDDASNVKIIVVGVADNINELIHAHQSAERAIEQIPMPRMLVNELQEIIDRGLTELGMTIEAEATRRITHLSRGFPHYTHNLAQHAAVTALLAGRRNVETRDVSVAVTKVIGSALESISTAYEQAVTAARRDSLRADVLLACAMATTDDHGFFYPRDVCAPLSKIKGEPYTQDNFHTHLAEFCSDERRRVLTRVGTKNKYRYRFSNAMLQPYVVLNGLASNKIKIEDV